MKSPQQEIEVAIVGKYVQLSDAYLSVVEALSHAAIAVNSDVKLRWINAEDLETGDPQIPDPLYPV